MKTRWVESILPPPPVRWVGNGFKVHNFFPGEMDIARMSPFVLLDYNAPTNFPPSDYPQGVGVHPHRGIETVTVSYKGRIAHHDSAGHGGVIGEGDLQWMTAGGGVLHKEYHEEEFNREGGMFHMAQIWVNLPAKDKMTSAKYQTLAYGDIPKIDLPDGAGSVEVIAGNYDGTPGIAATFSPMEMYNIKLNAGGRAEVNLPGNYNTGVLVVAGQVKVNGTQSAPADHFILFENESGVITFEADRPSILLVLSGEPLNEPIAAGGPFVMNTRQELMQAYRDYQDGKFGYLAD